MLRTLLTRTQLLGKPEEFLNPRGVMQRHVERSGARSVEEYFRYLRAAAASPNGVFAMKVAWPDFAPIVAADCVGSLLSPVRFVYLVRHDLLGQAISGVLAQRRNVWHSYTRRPTERMPDAGRPDVDEVERELAKLLAEQGTWERFFALHGVVPHRISYEGLVADPIGAVRGIATFLGVDVPADRIEVTSETERLADEVNQRWRDAVLARHPL